MNEFCECINPKFVETEVHSEEGGEIICRVIGEYCVSCGKDRAPKETESSEV